MEMDMRSSDPVALASLEKQFLETLDRALADENRRWGGKGAITLEKSIVGARPAGRVPAAAPMLQAAGWKRAGALVRRRSKKVPRTPTLDEASECLRSRLTGRGETGAHSLSEAFDTTRSWQGTARAFLVAIALARRP